MKKIKGLICLYLTVAVLLGVAVVPYASTVLSDSINGVVEKASGYSEDAENSGETKSVTADDKSEETFCETETVYPEEMTTDADVYNVNKEDTAHKNDTSDEIFDKEEVSSENSSDEFFTVNLSQDNSYYPGSGKETVTGLNIFTDTYGMLSSPDSINVYTFTLDTRAVFRYSVSHDKYSSLAGWNIALYQEYFINGDGGEKGYRLINTITTDPSVTFDSSSELGLLKGEYRLVVTQGTGYSPDVYSISVTIVEGSKYETECNDNVYRYNDIYSDIPVKGTASRLPDRQDEDWYMFRMNTDGIIELSFTHAEIADKLSVCWQVIFYSEDMTQLFSVNSEFNTPTFESGEVGLTAGNYYVAVINRVYTDIIYTLKIERSAVDDAENERNDSKETANEIAVNTTVTGSISAQINGIDRDYFRFNLPEAGAVVLEFAHEAIGEEEEREGWNYRLLTSDESVVFAGVSQWADDVSASSLIGLPRGTYYVLIDSEGLYHNTERYYLTVSFIEGDEWESEINDSFSSADELLYGVPVNAVLSDRRNDYDFDFFTFTLIDEEYITVDFSHEVLGYSRDIFSFTLYNENGQPVASTADSGSVYNISVMSDTEKTSAEYTLLPGKYYIRVSAGIFFDHIGYKLSYYESITEDKI